MFCSHDIYNRTLRRISSPSSPGYTADTSSLEDSSGSVSFSPIRSQVQARTSEEAERAKDSSEEKKDPENKLSRIFSPSSGYSSQEGTSTQVSKESHSPSPRHKRGIFAKFQRFFPGSGSTPPPLREELKPVTTVETVGPSVRALRELFNIPPPPKIHAPPPPPPEVWFHSKCSFELLLGPPAPDNLYAIIKRNPKDRRPQRQSPSASANNLNVTVESISGALRVLETKKGQESGILSSEVHKEDLDRLAEQNVDLKGNGKVTEKEEKVRASDIISSMLVKAVEKREGRLCERRRGQTSIHTRPRCKDSHGYVNHHLINTHYSISSSGAPPSPTISVVVSPEASWPPPPPPMAKVGLNGPDDVDFPLSPPPMFVVITDQGPPPLNIPPPPPYTAPPPPVNVVSPPTIKKVSSPPPPKITSPPPKSKEIPPPPPPKETSPPTPPKHVSPPPPPKEVSSPPPPKEVSPPPPKKVSPPPSPKKTSPPTPPKEMSPQTSPKGISPPSPPKETSPPSPPKEVSSTPLEARPAHVNEVSSTLVTVVSPPPVIEVSAPPGPEDISCLSTEEVSPPSAQEKACQSSEEVTPVKSFTPPLTIPPPPSLQSQPNPPAKELDLPGESSVVESETISVSSHSTLTPPQSIPPPPPIQLLLHPQVVPLNTHGPAIQEPSPSPEVSIPPEKAEEPAPSPPVNIPLAPPLQGLASIKEQPSPVSTDNQTLEPTSAPAAQEGPSLSVSPSLLEMVKLRSVSSSPEPPKAQEPAAVEVTMRKQQPSNPAPPHLPVTPCSTASFIFSKSNKRVVIETKPAPEDMATVQKVAGEAKWVKKEVKVPPPVARKPKTKGKEIEDSEGTEQTAGQEALQDGVKDAT
ncbi:extensin-2-like [Gymnodraco acuticeps]|uniref:Extensin-2-like n=1 Tax=Gymnodraco acuticeps TaxID=8218 RepID=A0A6P8UYV3_GYMAC|nr:extensin-2-like [Gymnodraco acuticeps]